MPVLPDSEIEAALARLPNWRRVGNAIVRKLRFPSFAEAMRFVNRVAEAAERADHHPDFKIHYTEVELSLWSHDAGGITRRDLRMAAAIDALGDETGPDRQA